MGVQVNIKAIKAESWQQGKGPVLGSVQHGRWQLLYPQLSVL